jgi:hypothetical protein
MASGASMPADDQGSLFSNIEPLFLRERRNDEARELVFCSLLPALCLEAGDLISQQDYRWVREIEERLLRVGRAALIRVEELELLRRIAIEVEAHDRYLDS